MVKKIGTLSSIGTIDIPDVRKYEHHKIYVKATSYISEVVIRVEDITIGDDSPVDLSSSGIRKITSNDTYCYVHENARCEKLRLNFVSGDANLEVYYNGW